MRIEFREQILKSSFGVFLFCSLWELQAWDRHEVRLVGSGLGRPWFAASFSRFGKGFILFGIFWFFPFGYQVGLSRFIVSNMFPLLFLVAICLEAKN